MVRSRRCLEVWDVSPSCHIVAREARVVVLLLQLGFVEQDHLRLSIRQTIQQLSEASGETAAIQLQDLQLILVSSRRRARVCGCLRNAIT